MLDEHDLVFGKILPIDRLLDLWAAGKWLTTDDNVVFLPSFLRCLLSSAAQVRRRDLQPSPFPDRAPAEIFTLLRRKDPTGYVRNHS